MATVGLMENIEFNFIKAKKSAHSCQTLSEHTDWVVRESMKLIDEVSLKKVSKNSGFSESFIRDLIFFSAYFHDIGKASVEFQNKIDGQNIKAFHSFYSFNLTYELNNFDFNNINLLSLIVLTHHTSYYDDIFNNMSEKFQPIFPFVEQFFYNYRDLYFELLNKNAPHLQFTENYDFSLDEMKESIKYLENDRYSFRILYSYVSGILNLADWIASAKFNKIEFDFSNKLNNLEFKFKLKDFQEQIANLTSSAIVEIPTGEGKTEGSLLWAFNNLQNKNTKIIYTLPTQTTSNKLFERIKNIFDNVGLIHSSAKMYLQDEYEKENGYVDQLFYSDYIFNKTFSKPVTVATLDSLLKNFINIGRFNIATVNYLNSVVIIDEVHSYDFKLLGFLKRFLEISNKFEVKVLIMSASIPEILKIKLEIDKLPIIKDSSLFNKTANYIYKIDKLLENSIFDILEKFNSGKRVLVIANTIKKSVEIFNALNVENSTLFHSQFKKIDRPKKENEIFDKLKTGQPYILVATQIVEISLDIDFDVLFSEVAPIDSLIQRFGRVNRNKNQSRIGEIFIFNYREPKPYDDLAMKFAFEIVETGFFPISRYVQWLNIYYDRLLQKDVNFQNKFNELFKTGYKIYDEVLKKPISENKIYDLRDIENEREDFLLIDDYKNGKTDFEHTISLPSIYSKKNLYSDKTKNNYWRILNLTYNYKTGVNLL